MPVRYILVVVLLVFSYAPFSHAQDAAAISWKEFLVDDPSQP